MKRPVRQSDGCYYIDGKKYKELFGSREQVMNGTAYKTLGELTAKDLMYNKHGRIVSAVKYKTAKKEMRLEKYGYGAKKGKFGYVKISAKNRTKKNVTRNNHMKGGDCGCGAKGKIF
jgi:hypothetical protein